MVPKRANVFRLVLQAGAKPPVAIDRSMPGGCPGIHGLQVMKADGAAFHVKHRARLIVCLERANAWGVSPRASLQEHSSRALRRSSISVPAMAEHLIGPDGEPSPCDYCGAHVPRS